MAQPNSPDLMHIDEVEIPSSHGLIGITVCPGRKDLVLDLAIIHSWGAEILIGLIESAEYAGLGIEKMPAMIPAGMRYLQLPIPDGSVPDAVWELRWKRESPLIHSVLERGGKVCVHCMGGLGRSGLVAARLLVESGITSEQAIRMVRAARPGAIETSEQEAYVRGLSTRSFFIQYL